MSTLDEKILEALHQHELALQNTMLSLGRAITSSLMTVKQTTNEYGNTVNSLLLNIPPQNRNTVYVSSWIISFDPTNITSLTLILGRYQLKYSAGLTNGFIDTFGKSVILRPNDTRQVVITVSGGTPTFINALLMGFNSGDQGATQ